MAITYEAIKSANERVGRMEIKRRDKKTGQVITKHYACVAERVQAFREICPEGCIFTDVNFRETSDGRQMCICKASVLDENSRLLATGHAYEVENSSQINETSFLENAETSAIGRALAVLGLGSETSMASAEEMVNALYQQDAASGNVPKFEPKKVEAIPEPEDEKARKVAVDVCNMLFGKAPEAVQQRCKAMLNGRTIEALPIASLTKLKLWLVEQTREAAKS